MKKVLIIALGIIMIAPFIYETSVSAEQVPSNSTANKPYYWQGWAKATPSFKLFITVYQDNNQCYSYYAVATKRWHIPSNNSRDISPTELVVKTKNNRYYVTYDNDDYYFDM